MRARARCTARNGKIPEHAVPSVPAAYAVAWRCVTLTKSTSLGAAFSLILPAVTEAQGALAALTDEVEVTALRTLLTADSTTTVSWDVITQAD